MIALCGSARTSDPSRIDYVVTEKQTFAFLPPIPVSLPNHEAVMLSWTSQPNILSITGIERPKGPNRFRDLLKLGDPSHPRAVFTWKVGDPAARKLTDLKSGNSVGGVYTAKSSNWFLVFSGPNPFEMVAVNSRSGATLTVSSEDYHQKILTDDTYPDMPVYILSTNKRDRSDIKLSRFDFQTGEKVFLSEIKQEGMKLVDTRVDSDQKVIGFFFSDNSGGPRLVHVYGLNQGKFLSSMSEEEFDALTENSISYYEKTKWRISYDEVEVEGLSTPFWEIVYGSLEESSPRVKIVGANHCEISSDEKYIAYISSRLVGVREILPLSEKMVEEVQHANEERSFMRLTREIAIAIQRYARDNDGSYPPSIGFSDYVTPYMPFDNDIKNFEYKRPEKMKQEIEDLSSLVVGTMKGKYGSAVAYGDGKVKWIPNPKSENG
jgi:hypothetical protein